MTAQTRGVPEGFTTLTPHLVVAGGEAAIAFYEQAFGAELLHRQMAPDGTRLLHATVRIGDSMLMLADEFPEFGSKGPNALGGSPVTVHLYFPDADAAFDRAVAAGAAVAMPLADMFWGDRYGRLTDPFGHHWSIGAHIRDVPPEEMAAAAAAMFAEKE